MILVCGATGELGARIARRLAAPGAPLRLLVRDGAVAPLADELDAEVVRGDLRDPPSVDRAVRGMATVITTVTSMARAWRANGSISARSTGAAP
jgi:uncharacterized protein YbjT (DUF2867 family)